MVDMMWAKCSESSDNERRKKGQVHLCISGGVGSRCGSKFSVSAPYLLTQDCAGHNRACSSPVCNSPAWTSPEWRPTPRSSRNLSEVVLRQLEKYIDSSNIKLLEKKKPVKTPPISCTPETEDKIESLRKEHEKSISEEGTDIVEIEISDNKEKVEEKDKSDTQSQVQHENVLEKELTQEEFDTMVGILRGYIEVRDMYALWNYVKKSGREEYLKLKEELWKDCENMSLTYNIPEELTMKEWKKAYQDLKDKFRTKVKDDYADLKVFIDEGCNLRWEYIAFIIQKYESWEDFVDTAKESWKKSLSEIFEKYVEDAQEKKIEKTPKTGTKVHCDNKYNEENKIMVSEILS
ncbi:hypothetical protein AK88_04174 [Plasmodium fragile]|uniref:Plasmodium RESA N-terminal domain-containing protein n=1 Tax=Plasmodium fragile TaxID=5857 RepID=A0A0D9QGX1_PLAFR|nr:uncharacterized protein AK88_04174 [Plasmodium fragile]KJP86203.1 hypothetical protein AK88_04174 [Plasmodium fragile]